SLGQAPSEILRGSNEEVEWEIIINALANLHCLVKFVARRHDDEYVHIAIGVRLAVGVRAKEDDLVGMKGVPNFASEAANQTHGNIGTAIPARQCDGHRVAVNCLHVVIILAKPPLPQRTGTDCRQKSSSCPPREARAALIASQVVTWTWICF